MSEEADRQFLPDEEANWRRSFQQFDIDTRGSLDQEQFLAMLVSAGVRNGEAIFAAIGHDEEGAFLNCPSCVSVSLKCFVAFLRTSLCQ